MKKSLDARWRVILDWQQRLQNLQPGSIEADILEHAISLAIASKSQQLNEKFLSYDILRNARFSLLRTKSRQHQLLQKVTTCTHAQAEDADRYTASNLESDLRTHIIGFGKNFTRCFDDLVNSESVATTAIGCGISRRSADRLRQKVRQIVQSFLDQQEVA